MGYIGEGRSGFWNHDEMCTVHSQGFVSQPWIGPRPEDQCKYSGLVMKEDLPARGTVEGSSKWLRVLAYTCGKHWKEIQVIQRVETILSALQSSRQLGAGDD